jgi:hypothetical protein
MLKKNIKIRQEIFLLSFWASLGLKKSKKKYKKKIEPKISQSPVFKFFIAEKPEN